MRTRHPVIATLPRLLRALALGLALAAAGAAHAGTDAPAQPARLMPMPADVLPLVPLPAQLTRGEGVLRLAPGAVVAVPAGDPGRAARRASWPPWPGATTTCVCG